MKKIIKFSLSIFSVLTLLTACSGTNETGPIIGPVAENEIPSEPKLSHAAISDNLEAVKAESPVKSFIGVNGETLSVDSAVNVIEPDPETYSEYAFIYDYAYFTYDANVYTVKRGDKLQNGLICTDAETAFNNNGGDVFLLSTEACFSGELTLTGTIRCTQEEEPIVGKGALTFIPGEDNGNIPSKYEISLSEKSETDAEQAVSNHFQLGNISDLPEEYASLIKDNEYTDVQITIKDIHLSCANNKTNLGSSAVIADLKLA